MADISDYLGLITSEHSDKPKFMATVQAVLQPLVDVINAADGLAADFDLDLAIGAQLDIVGLWVGISRNVNAPLSGVYFSLDIVGLGFDQGAWKGPFDPDTGIVSLDDDTYRTLIRAKIGANRWDGTLGQSKEILDLIFSGDTHVFIEDHQDMSIVLGVSGVIPSALFLALLTGGYIPIKPEGVQMSVYVVTSVSGAPIFGFDMNNQYVAGFDTGAWGGSAANVVYPQPLAFDFTTGALDSLISFSRASTGTRFNASGVLETVAANAPRFDYDPVTLQPRGLLIEEQRTNLAAVSNGSGLLTPTRATWVDTGQKFIDGSTPMYLLREDATASSSHFGVPSVRSLAANTAYAMYYIVQAAGRTKVSLNVQNTGLWSPIGPSATFDLTAATFTQANGAQAFMRNLGNGFWMIGFVATMGVVAGSSNIYPILLDSSGATSYSGDGVSGMYIGGMQIEAGAFPTSYIPTAGAQATRAADVAFVPISTWFNNLEGTLQAKFQVISPAQANRVASLYSSAGQMITIDSNGQCEVDGTFVSPASAGGNAAVAFKAGDAAAAVAGAVTGTGAPPALPDFPKALYIGSLDGQSQFLNGRMQMLTYQPKRLVNSDLIALTT